MTKYYYQIMNSEGMKVKGYIEASSLNQAADQIKKDDFFILELKPATGNNFLKYIGNRGEVFSSFEKINFTDHLGSMIESGTPIVDALEAYIGDETRGGSLVQGIIKDVESGKKLSDALRKYPKTFSSLYLALIASGETTGSLDETLKYLANELRREHEFKERVKSALFYPVLVIIVAIIVVTMLVVLVIPKITEVTKSMGGDLPLMTKIVSAFSQLITKYGIFFAIFMGLSITAFIYLLKMKSTRIKIDPYILKIPLIGKVIRKYTLARFLRIIGSCIEYGIPLSTAFMAVSEVADNSAYKRACLRIDQKIIKGVNLSKCLSDEGVFLFPNVIVRTIRGAEKTGNLGISLTRLSKAYELEVDRDLKRVTDLIEPLLVVFLGIVVGAIAISVIAPIYQMTSRIK